MVRVLCVLLGLLIWLGLAIPPVMAAPADPLKQAPIEVTVSLGNEANELKFGPDYLEFQTGKRYKLILSNPSPQKHYFTAKDFADGIWTQKVEAGRVEVKGAIHELELKPAAIAEWVFIPLKAGQYEVRCPIPGHTEAGMRGKLLVQ
ncbi:hypothetical protein BST81_24905 [Leptolyngbya sp. 'hensonii']|nr:hypothetical protein BST81_24905 [Leptolyngbya sp. 'hensonii']